MKECSRCGADTVIEECGLPICVKCAAAEDEEGQKRKQPEPEGFGWTRPGEKKPFKQSR